MPEIAVEEHVGEHAPHLEAPRQDHWHREREQASDVGLEQDAMAEGTTRLRELIEASRVAYERDPDKTQLVPVEV